MRKHIIEAITENGYWISGLIDDNPFNMRVEDELPDVIKFERIDSAFLIDKSNHDARFDRRLPVSVQSA